MPSNKGKIMTEQEQQAMQQRIADLEAKLLRALKPKTNTIKVSPKGGVSIYGLGKFPVTLYASQWEKLFAMQDDIKEFILDHTAELAVKESAATAGGV